MVHWLEPLLRMVTCWRAHEGLCSKTWVVEPEELAPLLGTALNHRAGDCLRFEIGCYFALKWDLGTSSVCRTPVLAQSLRIRPFI